MTWRPTPNGQPACSMRRRRSWRPSGYACSRTRPCGSVSSPTCPPTSLRPGPARPASARPSPCGGGHANRCHATVAGGRRGDGPRRRYGPPSGLPRRAGSPAERHCRTREVMPPPMTTSRQRLLCVAHNDSDVASPRPTPTSRVGLRTHRHSWWHIRSGACTMSLPRRAGRAAGSRPAAGRPGPSPTTSSSDRPGRGGASSSSGGPITA